MRHDDSVPHDTAVTEMCRMHGEAAEASAELERLRNGIRALADVCDVYDTDDVKIDPQWVTKRLRAILDD